MAPSLPIFMPVGTGGSVKAITQAEPAGSESWIISGQYLSPLPETRNRDTRKCRWFTGFMNWDQLILTDSGGCQVFSLLEYSN